MKKTLVVCLALLVFASLCAMAQDSGSRTITINGGETSVYMGTIEPPHVAHRAACAGFHDNICGHGYVAKIGWTVSDGSPVNFEWSPANQFKSAKSGTTRKIAVGLGLLQARTLPSLNSSKIAIMCHAPIPTACRRASNCVMER